jgi:hypothetical protein
METAEQVVKFSLKPVGTILISMSIGFIMLGWLIHAGHVASACLQTGHVWTCCGYDSFKPRWRLACSRCGHKEWRLSHQLTQNHKDAIEKWCGFGPVEAVKPSSDTIAVVSGDISGWVLPASLVTPTVKRPCAKHTWACDKFDSILPGTYYDQWHFTCTACQMDYWLSRDDLCEAERQMIEKWCGMRPVSKKPEEKDGSTSTQPCPR